MINRLRFADGRRVQCTAAVDKDGSSMGGVHGGAGLKSAPAALIETGSFLGCSQNLYEGILFL